MALAIVWREFASLFPYLRYAGRDMCLSWHRDRAEAQGSSDAGQV